MVSQGTWRGGRDEKLQRARRVVLVAEALNGLVANLDGGRSYHLDNTTFMLC